MQKIKNWTAKRAGGRITITGIDQDTGEAVKVVGVDSITASTATGGSPIATDKNAVRYELR